MTNNITYYLESDTLENAKKYALELERKLREAQIDEEVQRSGVVVFINSKNCKLFQK